MAILTAILLLLGGLSTQAQTTATKEYQVKAAFLFNFTQFVEWPAEAFADSTSPIVIGILGDNPFDNALDELVRGEKVNNRPITIERYRHAEEIKTCHILFICKSEAKRLDLVLAEMKYRNILTVGESDNFSQAGGITQFFTDKSKIRLKINPEAAKTAGLTLSSKLLRLAEIVSPRKG